MLQKVRIQYQRSWCCLKIPPVSWNTSGLAAASWKSPQLWTTHWFDRCIIAWGYKAREIYIKIMCDSHLQTLHPKPSPSIWHSMAHLPIKHITKGIDQLCTVKCNRTFFQYQYLLTTLKETIKIQNVISYRHCSFNSLQTIFLFIC